MSGVVTARWSALSEEREHITGRALLFELAGVNYAVSVEFVERVIELQEITPVPGSEPWLCGVVVHDFLPYPLIDPKPFLLPDRESVHTELSRQLTRAIVIDSAHGSVLLGVDKLVTIADLSARVRVDSKRAEFPEAVIEYTCKSEDMLIGVISVPRLLRAVSGQGAQSAEGAFS